MRLKGKKVLITGAGGGIGGAITLAFAEEGADLICADLNKQSLEKTCEEAQNFGVKALPIEGNLSEESHSRLLAETAENELNGLTTIVSCAIRDVSYLPVTQLPLKEWNDSLEVNLTGVFLLLKHSIPIIASSGGGSIILVASQLALTPKPGRAWYSSQKGALRSLAKALAVDHAGENIRANTLSPGPTADDRFFSQWSSEEEAHQNSSTLFNRLGMPEEMASGAVFLASDDSSFVTGTDLLIDGGYTAK